MRVRVTQHERQAVRLALCQGNLKGIVIGDVVILQVIDIVQIRELRVVRLGGNLGRSVRSAAVVAGGSTGQTLPSGAVRVGRISPTGAESANRLRLIQVRYSEKPLSVVADIRGFQRKAPGKCVLNTQVAGGDIGSFEIPMHCQNRTGLRSKASR